MTFAAPFSRVITRPFGGVPTSGGWWLAGGISAANCVAAYQPKGAASYALSKVNLANPGTYNATDGAAYPTWDISTGWTFNGSSQYLDSTVVPLIDQTWSAIIRLYGTSFNSVTPLFCRGGTDKDFGMYLEATKFYPHNGKNVGITVDIRNTDTTIAVVGSKGYKAGSILTGTIPTGTPPTTKSIYIGAGNNNGTAAYFTAANIYCAAIYKAVLTEPQVLSLHNAMMAL